MKFVKVRYDGMTPYTDRTPLKNAWEPGDVKLVSEADARALGRYLEFQRVTDEAEAEPKKPGKAKKADAVTDEAEAALAQAQLAQQQAATIEKQNKDAIEDTLVEISVMEKAALEAYARQNYGVDLDKRRSLDNLRNQVTELVQGVVN